MSSTQYDVRGSNALIRLDYPPVNGLGAALREGLMQRSTARGRRRLSRRSC